ncbi:hypothetical protein PTKIN_Ptkin03bG0162200 [Pterospermum kingtungense]
MSSCSMQVLVKIDRDVSGKLRRQQPRRPPATLYAQPQQNQSLRTRLLSKLVDPACHLIAGDATRASLNHSPTIPSRCQNLKFTVTIASNKDRIEKLELELRESKIKSTEWRLA